MRTNGRHPDQHFHSEEYIFRRVPIGMWNHPGDHLEVDAVPLPDVSVGRSKYGHPEWVRFDVINGNFFPDWGVVGIQVADVPSELWREGVFHFTFKVCHAPIEMDFPHSEIRAFENQNHIDVVEKVPEDVHLAWRERLLRKMRTIIKPYQRVVVRQIPPKSHKLEPFATEQ